MRIGNNIPKQVYENTKNIEKLQNDIKPEYNCSATLTSSSVSVAIASTNAPAGTDSGWLLTEDGLKFKITGGDGTNLLLEFYANLKGPQGEDGAALNIDDNTTSLTKVWSSSKTNNEIQHLINDSITSNFNTWSSDQQTRLLSSGIAWTTTDKDGDDQISLDDIYIGSRTASESASIIKVPMLKVSDIIVYVDGDLKAKTLYRVASISSGVATVSKVCDFGGGKQLYQHIISVNNWSMIITNDISTKLTFTQLREYLYNNGCRSYSTTYPASGVAWADSKLCPIFGCFAFSLSGNISMVYRSGLSNYNSEEISSVIYSTDWDKVVAL